MKDEKAAIFIRNQDGSYDGIVVSGDARTTGAGSIGEILNTKYGSPERAAKVLDDFWDLPSDGHPRVRLLAKDREYISKMYEVNDWAYLYVFDGEWFVNGRTERRVCDWTGVPSMKRLCECFGELFHVDPVGPGRAQLQKRVETVRSAFDDVRRSIDGLGVAIAELSRTISEMDC